MESIIPKSVEITIEQGPNRFSISISDDSVIVASSWHGEGKVATFHAKEAKKLIEFFKSL